MLAEKLGLPGVLSRKSLLEVRREGIRERLLGQEPSELGLQVCEQLCQRTRALQGQQVSG